VASTCMVSFHQLDSPPRGVFQAYLPQQKVRETPFCISCVLVAGALLGMLAIWFLARQWKLNMCCEWWCCGDVVRMYDVSQ
jgi:hypothetical protein